MSRGRQDVLADLPVGSLHRTQDIGEIGIVGTVAAVSHAVFHAIGVRARELPVTPDALLPGCPQPNGRPGQVPGPARASTVLECP